MTDFDLFCIVCGGIVASVFALTQLAAANRLTFRTAATNIACGFGGATAAVLVFNQLIETACQ